MNIQWYPGHMVKARRIIKENIKLIDAVLEMVDARAPISTHIPDLCNFIGNKDIIKILNKSDLADKKITDSWIRYFKANGIKAIAVNSLQRSGIEKINKLVKGVKTKSLLNTVKCMVVGIPNVGKSSLINQLAARKSAKTADVPGVTKNKMWVKTGSNILLLDTPGTLWPKFENTGTGVKLALLGSIKQELLNSEQLALILLRYLIKYYPNNLNSRYKINLEDSPEEILKKIAANRGYLLSGGIPDIEKTAKTIISEFRHGKMGGISLEKPEEDGGFWSEI